MRLLILLNILLVGCSGIRTEMNAEDLTQMKRLGTRCELESEEIYKKEDPKLMPIYCQCMLTSLADGNLLKTQGTEVAIKKLNDNYKISVDISRAIMSEDQERVDRFPREMVTSTGRQMDKCLDQAKSYFYEKEMDDRIKFKMESVR